MTRKCKKDDKFVKYVKAGACEDGVLNINLTKLWL